jgi:hypothetical protein
MPHLSRRQAAEVIGMKALLQLKAANAQFTQQFQVLKLRIELFHFLT